MRLFEPGALVVAPLPEDDLSRRRTLERIMWDRVIALIGLLRTRARFKTHPSSRSKHITGARPLAPS